MYVQIYTYIYINESLFCTPETNTALYINYTSIIKKKKEQKEEEEEMTDIQRAQFKNEMTK